MKAVVTYGIMLPVIVIGKLSIALFYLLLTVTTLIFC